MFIFVSLLLVVDSHLYHLELSIIIKILIFVSNEKNRRNDVKQISSLILFSLVSSITTRYGDQNNTAMGRHGSVESKIEYY